MNPEERKAFQAQANGSGGWEGIWKGGLQPGQKFDASRTSPYVADVLGQGELRVKGKTVLVPGCGRGYDVVEFARHGASSAVGLEISPTAVGRARDYRDEEKLDADVAARTRFDEGDFFEYTPAEGPVDIGYDYTFLCALPPELRQKWAQAWARLIKPGGELVTMIFPVDETLEGGPPYAVKPYLYKDLLEPVGFENTYMDQVPPFMSHKGRGGKEWFGRWERKSKI